MKVKTFLGIFQKLFFNKNAIDLIVRLVIFLVIIVILLFFLEKVIQKKKNKKLDLITKMSIFNDGSSGTMAFKEFLESLNYNVEKIMDPLSGISIISKIKNNNTDKIDLLKKPGIILIIEPESFFQNKDSKIIEEIARKGFVFMIFSKSSSNIKNIVNPSEKDNAFIKEEETDFYKDVSSDLIKIAYDKNRVFYDVKKIFFNGKKRIKDFGKEWQVLARDNQGVLAIEKKVGKGSILIVSDSEFLSNLDIRKYDNALFGYRLVSYYSKKLKNLTIYFDEFHHGFHKKYTFLYFFAKKEYFSVILQIIIFFILLFYFINIRFGQYKVPISKEEKRIYYFSESMAGMLLNKKYSEDIYGKIKNNFYLLLKFKSHNFKKDSKTVFDSFIEKNKNKKKKSNLIKKLFLIIKKHEYKKTGGFNVN